MKRKNENKLESAKRELYLQLLRRKEIELTDDEINLQFILASDPYIQELLEKRR